MRYRPLPWWAREVFYEVYLRSFQDSDGDGVGDLRGLVERLDYLQDLGVGALWITPFYPSSGFDGGYDVSDHCTVDPSLGSLEDFGELVTEAHRRELRVVIDLVANHTSTEHPWFLESASSRASPKRNWYVWRDPAPDGSPPNNWQSFFGGPAWTFDPASGQYYLHQFLPQQPDLNYRNPEVVEALLEIARFWLERGVDGFRVDAAWVLVEDREFRDEPPNPDWKPGMRERDRLLHVYTEDQPETHHVLRQLRSLVEAYSAPGQERVLIGEVYLPLARWVLYYGTQEGPECHFPLNPALVDLPVEGWQAETLRTLVAAFEAVVPPWGWPSWVLGNHDRPRVVTRLGQERARLAHLLLFTLRGTPTLYYGDELCTPDGSIPLDQVRDLAGLQEWGGRWTRDAARTPMAWNGGPKAGFTTGDPWLPLNPKAATCNVASQQEDPRSMLNFVRALLRLRRKRPALSTGSYRERPAPLGVLAYERQTEADRVVVMLNFQEAFTCTGIRGRVLLSSYMDREGREEDVGLRPWEGLVVDPENDGFEW